MINDERTLYIHAGSPKTGSSALQFFLHKNRSILAQTGISYEFSPDVEGPHETADNISGNGAKLIQACMSHDPNLAGLIEAYFNGAQAALISTELIYNLSADSLQLLADCCSESRINVSIIVFVRNVGPFLWSAYLQLAKNHLATYSFEEYVLRVGRFPLAEYMERLLGAFSKDRIRVLHYDSQKGEIDLALVQSLGLDSEQFERSFLKRTINRSLSEFELSLMLKVNTIVSDQQLGRFGESLTSSLASALRARNPDLPSARLTSKCARRLIPYMFKDDMDWMNNSFFDGKQVISFFDPNERIDEAHVPDTSKLSVLDGAIFWAITELIECYKDSGRALVSKYVGSALQKVATAERPTKDLPDNFDPFYYFMTNLDVLRGADDPYQHFLAHGRGEGRAYTWRKS